MRHLALLASVYALVAGLVLPGSILAQKPSPTTTAAAPPAGETPGATETAPPAAEAAPAEPAPPAESAPPEPQFLADERDQAPAPKQKPKAIAAASGSVTIADFSFSPAAITVDQGDTVTWVNNGPTAHSATANGGEFDTGILKAGQSSSHTFSQAGTYSYFCQPHPFMKGTVVVQAAQTGGGTSGGETGGSGGGGDGGGSSSGATDGNAGAAQADGGPALPTTGADSGALLTLGGLMLLLGIAIHRRTNATG
jgi:LPXTG-motif cell wall-anchored protein